MSFIHSKEGQSASQVHGLEDTHEALSTQQLRCDEEEPEGRSSRLDVLQNAATLLSSLGRGQKVALDILLLQIGHLILHEGCKSSINVWQDARPRCTFDASNVSAYHKHRT